MKGAELICAFYSLRLHMTSNTKFPIYEYLRAAVKGRDLRLFAFALIVSDLVILVCRF
jgi:hypothetical protein